MEKDWEIIPRKGLGRLLFGMSPGEVEQLGMPYGPVESTRSSATTNAAVDETIRQFGDFFSQKDIDALLSTKVSGATDHLTEVRKGGALVLEYENGELESIMAMHTAAEASLAGVKLFGLEPLPLLQLLENANGGPGRFRSTNAAFDNIALSASGFCGLQDTNVVFMLTDKTEEYAERSITVRKEPYFPELERGDYHTYSLLPAN